MTSSPITRNWRRCSAVIRSVKFIPFMVLEREICVGSVICDTICRRWKDWLEGGGGVALVIVMS